MTALSGGLRTLEQLGRRQDREKHIFLEVRGAKEVTGWSPDQGTTYLAALELEWDNALRDVVGVVTNQGILTRRETLADVRSTAGTFFYKLFEGTATHRWDDGVSRWDDGVLLWDQLSFLYVHLPDGTNPNIAPSRIVAQFGFFFSNAPETHPTLGREILLNGDFENDLTNWFLGGGSATVAASSAEPLAGTKSALWTLNAASSNFKVLAQSISLNAEQDYRLLFLYSIRLDASARLQPRIQEGASNEWVQVDGRSWDSVAPSTENSRLMPTLGQLRLGFLDFRTRIAGTHVVNLLGLADAFSGTVITWDDGVSLWDDGILRWDSLGENPGEIRLDNVSLRPIHRWEPHEPRLSARSIPSVELGAGDVFFESQRVGSGNVSLVNADGFMDALPSSVALVGQKVVIRQGGRIPGETDFDIPAGAMVKEFSGVTRKVDISDGALALSLEDSRRILLRNLPSRVYSFADWPNLDTAIENRSRSLWYGSIDGISPNRVDLTTNGFGIYELADPTDMPNGIQSVSIVYAYLDGEAADAKDATRRIALTVTTDYTVDLSLAQLTIVRDVRIIEITVENGALDFDEGGSELTAFLDPGVYTPSSLATEVAAKMTAAAVATISSSYSESTHLFDVSTSGGTINLLAKTGANKSISGWSELDFDKKTDKNGATSYTAEASGFTSPEKDHFLRINGTGSEDDAAGTITGTAFATIELGTDIARALWTLDLGQDPGGLDEVSLVAARSLAPTTLGVFLSEPTEAREIFLKLQISNRADISVDGAGLFRYIVQEPGVVPSDVVYLHDADFESFETEETASDVYRKVVIGHSQDPSTAEFAEASAEDTLVPILYDRTNVKTLNTFHITDHNAKDCADVFLASAIAPPDKVSFVARIAESRVPGQKFLITRRRGVSSSGVLSNNLFRILSIRRLPLAGTVQVKAIQET